MASGSQANSINLRSRNVPPQGSGHVSPLAGENGSQAGDLRDPTPTSQLEQGATLTAGASSSNTAGANSDRGNLASNEPTPASEDPRLAGLTPIQRFRLMELEAEKQVATEQLKLAQLQSTRGHRREHSDDHYRDATRKKASLTKAPEKQSLNSYNAVDTFLQDCEEYIASAPRNDFSTDEEKVRWSSNLLVDAKKQTWRNERATTLRETGEPTWEYYKAWCLNQVRNPAVKAHDVGRQLARAHMKETQSVSSFNDYLASLWAQMDRVVTDVERMEALHTRVLEKIPLEAMKEATQPTTYAAMLLQYQGIEQRLRRTKDLPALEKNKSGDKAGSQGSGGQQHSKPKGQHAKDHNKGASTSASQGSKSNKPARNKPEGGNSRSKQKKPLAEVQCYDCQQYGHYKGQPECANYVANNETRNQGSGGGKGKT